jgi:hypothetical protein
MIPVMTPDAIIAGTILIVVLSANFIFNGTDLGKIPLLFLCGNASSNKVIFSILHFMFC